ncbi:hypothetical protein JOF53_000727 [Crossiella equi]|uniref:TfuA-like core domain-containing protein n=1 Tax=Crossiella equi TaxID=130796 RepID=A0ABS5A5J3_9PSEU|nr:TfuA-like protein [Crossiella equi]MBP2471855.1 hypothetical protein [Crossiella equi]
MAEHLFAGPSLPDAAELAGGSGIRVHPPVAAGDLLALRARPGDVVGIVDGYFHQRRSVPHKEILHLLAGGVRVLGAASLGALRAAELHQHGMEGIGGIFADYRDGRLRADDEVTLVHGTAEDGYAHHSEPLVNIRASLAAEVDRGTWTAAEAEAALADLAARPYRDRHLRALGRPVPLVDRKRADALELLAALRTAGTRPEPPRFPETVHLHNWKLAADAEELRALALCQVLAPDYPELHARAVLDRIAEHCRTTCGGPGDALAHAVHSGLHAPGPRRCWTTEQERRELGEGELTRLFLVRSYRIRPGITDTALALRAFRASTAHGRALGLLPSVAAVNEAGRRHRADFDPAAIAVDQVLDFLAGRWRVPTAELELAAFDRGFSSLAGAVAAARQVFLAARCEPALAAFTMAA